MVISNDRGSFIAYKFIRKLKAPKKEEKGSKEIRP